MRPSPSRRRSGWRPRPDRLLPGLRTLRARSSQRSTSSLPLESPSRWSGSRSARWSAGALAGGGAREPRAPLGARALRGHPRRGDRCPRGLRFRYRLRPRPPCAGSPGRGTRGRPGPARRGGILGARRGGVSGTARARPWDLLALYRREGFLDAQVEVETVPVRGETGQDVTVVLSAGLPVRLDRVRIEALSGCLLRR